ncbi:MAG: EVE domain-containing protein [Oscillatoriales cyanobacterium RM1_1_9]|nr:EVE domain-containing protein [Oscillatoriales cyanobacterium SM2_3_0]NJO46794.1 EVE domain-containing protein [Oscillatoriales cyanobacterium RM2_1_1]NJO71181.1 EVE domain-containing protein [Oscillatoriales cyanobacterium RM1_1_9]
MNYWLMKSEPTVYSIENLARDRTTLWDGVRNYQARNFLRQMTVGNLAFFYHSNTKDPGIVGLMRVVEINLDDPTQFDRESQYYDPRSTPAEVRWQTVRVEFVEQFSTIVTLARLKQVFTADDLLLVRRGNRLSVMAVPPDIASKIMAMSQRPDLQTHDPIP